MTLVARFAVALALSLPFALVAVGCKKSENDAVTGPTPVATTEAPSPSAAPAAPTAAAPAADSITEEDFEAEAARSITADNLEESLDALEREIRAK